MNDMKRSIADYLRAPQDVQQSAKKSKTYSKMKETIQKEPKKFWYYNNGITIIASECDSQFSTLSDGQEIDEVTLTNFSIINGAQTTGTLGKILEEAEKEPDGEEIIKKLKEVYVLTRIMKTDGEAFKKSIAINNNTQNALSNRDLISRNTEQRELEKKLNNDEPKIFVQIVSGSTPPKNQRYYIHRKNSTNEFLAQLVFAAFLLQPGNAKDKKTSLFKFANDGTEVNKDYSKIFHYESDETKRGIIFKKSNKEIIKEFANFYLERTIDIIKGLVPDGSGVNNWIRNPNNQDKFMEKFIV